MKILLIFLGCIALYLLAILAMSQKPPSKAPIKAEVEHGWEMVCDGQQYDLPATDKNEVVQSPCGLGPGQSATFTACYGPDGIARPCVPPYEAKTGVWRYKTSTAKTPQKAKPPAHAQNNNYAAPLPVPLVSGWTSQEETDDNGYKWNRETGEIEVIPHYYSGFDVPAISTTVETQELLRPCYSVSKTEEYCPTTPPKTVFTCADKSRFLLFSEDGKAHCLRLVPHD